MIHPDVLWSCTTCRACMEVCPVGNEHIPAIIDMRRYMALSEGEPLAVPRQIPRPPSFGRRCRKSDISPPFRVWCCAMPRPIASRISP